MKFLCLIALLLVQNVYAEEVIQSFKVNKANPNMQKIADLFEVKDQLKESFLVYVLKEKVSLFRTFAPKATMVSLDINADIKDKNLQGYHKFDEVKELYYEFAKNHSDVAKIEVFGQSAKGIPLLMMLTELIYTGSTGLSPGLLVATAPIESTMSWPRTISPKTVCFPLSQGVSFRVIKN